MDENKHFQFADINQDEKAKELLTEFENELGEYVGGDIVLIAYKRNRGEDEWL
jgi:hypothetical protein